MFVCGDSRIDFLVHSTGTCVSPDADACPAHRFFEDTTLCAVAKILSEKRLLPKLSPRFAAAKASVSQTAKFLQSKDYLEAIGSGLNGELSPRQEREEIERLRRSTLSHSGDPLSLRFKVRFECLRLSLI